MTNKLKLVMKADELWVALLTTQNFMSVTGESLNVNC